MIPNLGSPPRRGSWSTDTPCQPTSFPLRHDGGIVGVRVPDSTAARTQAFRPSRLYRVAGVPEFCQIAPRRMA
jgi:hypothetical protein